MTAAVDACRNIDAESEKLRAFDPFEFNVFYRIRTKGTTSPLILVGVVMAVLLLSFAWLQGTLGGAKDFQVVPDAERILGFDKAAASKPDFPLIRDVASWLLLIIIAAGAMLLHKQWRLLAESVHLLARNGALMNREEISRGRWARILRVPQMLDKGYPGAQAPEEPVDPLAVVLARIMDSLTKWRLWIGGGLLAISGVLALVLVLAQHHGLFQNLAPSGLTGQARQSWLDQAYDSWWASENHPAGWILYLVFAVFAIFVILSFNEVGLIAVYLVLVLNVVAESSADWLNRDGRFGWTPIARLFRTVYWAQILLGSALSVTLSVLGIDNFPWISVLVGLYIVVIPIATGVPWMVFRRVERTARERRMARLMGLIAGRVTAIELDLEALPAVIAEITRCRTARIRPMRLRTGWYSTFIVVVLLPIVLAAGQILSPLYFGSH